MSRDDKHAADLRELARLLRLGPQSARAVQQALGVSKPTVYARIKDLPTLGYTVVESTAREGSRGPRATIYTVSAGPADT